MELPQLVVHITSRTAIQVPLRVPPQIVSQVVIPNTLRSAFQVKAPVAPQIVPQVIFRLASPVAAKIGLEAGETIHLQASIRLTPGTVPGTVPTATPEASFSMGIAV